MVPHLFQVELQMRPEFLRFIGTMEMKIIELEKSLDHKILERHATKKAISFTPH